MCFVKLRLSVFFCFLLFLSFLLLSVSAHSVVLFLSEEDLKIDTSNSGDDLSDDPPEWDDFGDSEMKSEEELDPGSWRPILESNSSSSSPIEDLYFSGIRKMIASVASGDPRSMEEAVSAIETSANEGFPHAQSALGLLYGAGCVKQQRESKSFLYHHFAAEGGNMQSKMALAYTYFRQDMHENAVKLYAELAEIAVASFFISRDFPIFEPVRIHNGAEENKETLRELRGEENEDFQITLYQAQKGNAVAMYNIGAFYYFGLRGVRRDYRKALEWFLKAVEKREPRSMELLGEIYARGTGVERNHTKALEWLTLASKEHHYSAYNGMGYLYVKGYGVEKNFSKALEYFEKAAENEKPGGYYNLGVLLLKGIGVKKDVKEALKCFIKAANAGQPRAFYQLAKFFQTGVVLKKNLAMAASLYKLVAEKGPWSSLSRWALESYLNGEIGQAFLLYYRMAEMGYEVAQSNAAWILDKYGEQNVCMGESGFCTEAERHRRSHSLWWQASEQGNEHAALLIGDAYYYGRGTERDYERAAEAYIHAQSQSNAQAMFNLGYMHEHGQGLPFDLHLAKRYYDQALVKDRNAALPVKLALISLWIRKNYANSLLVSVIDSLPQLYPQVEAWVNKVLLDEGNATIFTLFVCLLTVLYLRNRQRRNAAQNHAR